MLVTSWMAQFPLSAPSQVQAGHLDRAAARSGLSPAPVPVARGPDAFGYPFHA